MNKFTGSPGLRGIGAGSLAPRMAQYLLPVASATHSRRESGGIGHEPNSLGADCWIA
jgi:hypothetical protein